MIFSSIVLRDRLLNLSSCPNLDLNVGYHQVKWEPTMFIMLSYSWLFPRAYTVISFGSDQCYHLVHLIMEFHLHGNLDDLLLSPSTIFSSYPWFMLNIKLVLETLKAFLHASSWSICLVLEVTSSSSRSFKASCRHEFGKVCLAFSGIIPSQSCIRAKYSVVWRVATFILYESLAHQATNWFVQGEEVPS